MKGHPHDWVLFILGVLLALTFKCARWCYQGKKNGTPVGRSLQQWFFEATFDNGVSWFTSLFIVLPLGAVFIDKVSIGIPWLENLTVHWTFSLTFGILSEYLVPNFMKFIVGKVGGSS